MNEEISEETLQLLKDSEDLANHLLQKLDEFGPRDKPNSQVFLALASMIAVGIEKFDDASTVKFLSSFVEDVLFFKENATIVHHQNNEGITLQ